MGPGEWEPTRACCPCTGEVLKGEEEGGGWGTRRGRTVAVSRADTCWALMGITGEELPRVPMVMGVPAGKPLPFIPQLAAAEAADEEMPT